MDLLEVPLLEVIQRYLDDIEEREVEAHWDEMTEFLLLMSVLLEIKSRLLLPDIETTTETELTPELAREEFLNRLFTYSQFKAASMHLRDRGIAESAAITRAPEATPLRALPSLDSLAGTADSLELRRRLLHLLEMRREPDANHIAPVTVDLRRQIRLIRDALAGCGRFSFNTLFGQEEPAVQAVSLFGLLDMLGRREIRVSQRDLFADIIVSVGDRARGT